MEKIIKICVECGKFYQKKSNRQKRCTDCAKKIQNERVKEWNYSHRQHLAEYKREYYADEEHRAKHRARCKALSAERRGKLKKAEKCAVKGCKCTEDLQFHHIQYGGKWGAICCITLCKKHHYLEHRREKK